MMKRIYNVVAEVMVVVSAIVGMIVIVYLCTNIITTAIGLERINSEIRSEQEYAGTLHGYTDTTGFDDRIEELFELRREMYYRSENFLVRNFSTQSALLKFTLFIVALFVEVLFIFIGVVTIINVTKAVLKSFRR